MYDKEYENNMVQENLGLVVSQAVKYLVNKNDPNYDDYIQVGSIALLKAIRGYKPERDTKLSTYAWKAIQKAIQKEVHKSYSKTKPLPANLYINDIESIWEIIPDNLSELEQEVLDYRLQNMSLSEIGTEIGYSKEWVNQILNIAIDKIKRANQ